MQYIVQRGCAAGRCGHKVLVLGADDRIDIGLRQRIVGGIAPAGTDGVVHGSHRVTAGGTAVQLPALIKEPAARQQSAEQQNAPPSSAADLAAQAIPELAAQSYRLCDKGGRVAVYRCGTNSQPDVLVTVTGIYTNLLPENDAVRIKRGVTVYSERELDLLLEDLGG